MFDILAGPWALGLMGPSARFHGAALGQQRPGMPMSPGGAIMAQEAHQGPDPRALNAWQFANTTLANVSPADSLARSCKQRALLRKRKPRLPKSWYHIIYDDITYISCIIKYIISYIIYHTQCIIRYDIIYNIIYKIYYIQFILYILHLGQNCCNKLGFYWIFLLLCQAIL